MNRQLKLTFSIIVILIIAACHKRDVLQKSNFIDTDMARSWLHQNGLAYKNETISVQVPNSLMLTGKLNWQKAKQFNWEGRDYIDIPFEFAEYGKVIPGRDETAPAHFNLVLRKKGVNDFEGAVRTTMHLEQQVAMGSIKNFQSYQLLDGQSANTWMVKGDERKLFATQRLDIDPIAAANIELLRANKGKRQLGATGADRLMTEAPLECPPIALTSYQNVCWDDPIHGQYNVTCKSIRVTEYVPDPTCSSANNPQPPSSGGATGGPTNPFTPPTYPPDPNDNDDGETEKKDPCVEAARLAQEIMLDFNNPDIKNKIDTLKALAKTSKLELAFKFGVSNTTGEYKTTDMFKGGKTSVGYTYSTNNFTEKGSAHLHPIVLDGVPSAGDIYGLYDDVSINSTYLYDLVIWNDEVYMLGIVDKAAFSKFITKYPKVNHYDEKTHGWKWKSPLYRSYDVILQGYYNLSGNKPEAVEAALASIIDEYKMGIILQKWDASINKFKPLRSVDVEYKSTSGAVSGFGNTSPYQSITIKGCNY
ncbi:hypothetical protein ACLOAU_04185 [Niabella sp. CJ426]|uniref:hypothetical protein n=1 Tax=Niabella sp. CJ426 TaxID=3393740 RepID=UPI003D06A31E